MSNKLPPRKRKKKHTLSLYVCVCASHRTNKATNNISNTATATTLQYGVCIDRCTDTHKNNNSNASGDLLLCITLSAHARARMRWCGGGAVGAAAAAACLVCSRVRKRARCVSLSVRSLYYAL
jgi:hypothetical protein